MKKALLTFLIISVNTIYAQHTNSFTKQDTLRGSITSERVWWDLHHYDLSIKIKPEEKFISGQNTISYKVISKSDRLQIDLQAPMKITRATQDGKILQIEKTGNAHFITLLKNQKIGSVEKVTIHYEGKPKISNKPPWEGGFTWRKDENNIDFIATTCQGEGASLWWPCKDHMYDEPDKGINLQYTVPENLFAIGNGRLTKTTHQKNKHTKTYFWKTINPINNYGVHLSIGNYVHFSEDYQGEAGLLNCKYYVLKQNFSKAKIQFKEAARTLEAFEHWFGPYPFYEDGYKLVEVPYLGMEHQSAVTYGNGYKNGYMGRDLSGSGWGLKFDFIIVHESGHEWFANNITNKDIADMWVHESFTNYSESLFLEYHFGKKAANAYNKGLRRSILNDRPIIGSYEVNHEGSSDMYFKGSNMLHTIRQIIDNDTTWRLLLRELNKEFYHQTVTTVQVENFINSFSKINFSSVFDQYLRTIKIPVLEYKIKKNCVEYRWNNVVKNFDMQLKTVINSETHWLKPTLKWEKIILTDQVTDFSVDENFYINIKKM